MQGYYFFRTLKLFYKKSTLKIKALQSSIKLMLIFLEL